MAPQVADVGTQRGAAPDELHPVPPSQRGGLLDGQDRRQPPRVRPHVGHSRVTFSPSVALPRVSKKAWAAEARASVPLPREAEACGRFFEGDVRSAFR